jgi:DNA processing protein
MIDKEYWYWLCNIENFGLKKIEAILKLYSTPKEAFHENENRLKEIDFISDHDRIRYKISKDRNRIQENYAKLLGNGIYFVTNDDKEYPEKLHNIYNSPYALYIKGSLPDNKSSNVAIIGARDCSDYGREIATYFAMELAKAGLGIISGLARGVDGYAHEGALKVSGRTYGILGCGVDVCYPKENFSLYMDMQVNGGVISEYSPKTNPKAGNFPMRNRLISGMSDGIFVIEAKEKSGSLITVDMGLDQGKNIYALPGRVHDSLSKGCNNLIKMGAKLVSEPADILEDFLINYENSEKDMKNIDKLLETKEKIVYASLSLLPKHINEIAGETNINIMNLTEILINLELKDYIKEVRKNYYSLHY